MLKYYYQVLILTTFLFFGSKKENFGNKDINKYGPIFLNKNNPEKSTKN